MIVDFPSPIPIARAVLLDRASWIGCDRVATDMPAGALVPPFIRLTRVGDSRTSLVQETSRVLVECYGATDAAAEQVARRARAVLVGAGQDYVTGAWLYGIKTTAGVADYYDAERELPRFQFEVALTVRGQEVTP